MGFMRGLKRAFTLMISTLLSFSSLGPYKSDSIRTGPISLVVRPSAQHLVREVPLLLWGRTPLIAMVNSLLHNPRETSCTMCMQLVAATGISIGKISQALSALIHCAQCHCHQSSRHHGPERTVLTLNEQKEEN